jgi:glycosyltransferase involved in cell wall biosynthesis
VKNIGLITDIAFWEMGNGQNARIRELYAFLAQHSQLTLYYLGEDDLPFPGRIFPNCDKAQFASCLKQAQHDLVIVENIHLAWVADLEIKDTSIYLDAHDIISEGAEDSRYSGRPYNSLSLEEEIALFRKFDKVIFLLKEQTEKIAAFLGKDCLLCCPHPVVPEEKIVLREEVQTIGFFGGPSWLNIDSVQWFHDRVMPLLGDLTEKCIICGGINYSPFSFFSNRLARGPVFPSIHNYYQNIDITINPSLYRNGLKIKTVEALAYGIPLVTTSKGAHGFSEESNLSFLLADAPEDFAAAIRALDASLELRQRLSLRARAFAQQHFTPHACFSKLL